MDQILILLGDGVNKEQVQAIYNMYKVQLMVIVKQHDINALEIPEVFNFILTEATIERFNMIGSEGMKEEMFEEYTSRYRNDTSEILSKYLPFIDNFYNNSENKAKLKVRFI